MRTPPNMEGTWKVTEFQVRDGYNTIYNPERITYIKLHLDKMQDSLIH